ncbi:MAG: hypothetical protein ACTSYA_06365 [Candidatus Kariarchaeaceae archaeon]
MATSIELSDSSKEELLILKALLEKTTGEKHTLDETIKWLITQAHLDVKGSRKLVSDELFGCLSELSISLEDLWRTRKEKWTRFEDI